MGKMKDLDADMHELPDFEKGVQFERERIISLITDMTNRLPVKTWINPELIHLRWKIIKAIKGETEERKRLIDSIDGGIQ